VGLPVGMLLQQRLARSTRRPRPSLGTHNQVASLRWRGWAARRGRRAQARPAGRGL